MNRRTFLLALPVVAVAPKLAPATPTPPPGVIYDEPIPEMAMFDYMDLLIGAASAGPPRTRSRHRQHNAQARRKYAKRRLTA